MMRGREWALPLWRVLWIKSKWNQHPDRGPGLPQSRHWINPMSSSYIPCSKEDTYRVIERAQAGDEEARERLINQNTGLVKNIALKFVGSGHELEDLLRIGFIGLLKAVDRFHIGYGVIFSTYAVPMILGEIKRYLRDDGRIKVGRQVKQDVRMMKRAHDAFYHMNGRPSKISEFALQMEMDVEEVLVLMEANDALSNLESLDDPDRQENPPEKYDWESLREGKADHCASLLYGYDTATDCGSPWNLASPSLSHRKTGIVQSAKRDGMRARLLGSLHIVPLWGISIPLRVVG